MNWMGGGARQRQGGHGHGGGYTFRFNSKISPGRGGGGRVQRIYQLRIAPPTPLPQFPFLPTINEEILSPSIESKRPCPLIEMVKLLPNGSALAIQLSHQMEIDKVLPVEYAADQNEMNNGDGIGNGDNYEDDDDMGFCTPLPVPSPFVYSSSIASSSRPSPN